MAPKRNAHLYRENSRTVGFHKLLSNVSPAEYTGTVNNHLMSVPDYKMDIQV